MIRLLRGDIYENFAMGLQTLRSNKLRSFLTVIGVMIGVITVMLIASIISGIDEQVKKEIESFGTRSIFIAKFDPGIRVGRLSREERMRKELTYDDAVAVSQLPSVASAVGQSIDIGGQDFKVIGVIQQREQLFGGSGSDDINNGIYVPFNVARKLKPNADDVYILAVARPGQIDKAKDQITDLLRVRRQVPFGKPNNFGMATADSIIDQFRASTGGVAIAMVAISSVGLMVGGIGVMNIMLVSVTERTREIGIRKAIGARKKDILWQFLIEAMTLTGFGGLVGLLLGWATTLLIRLFVPSYVPLWAPVAGFVASVGIGLVFGLWPAWKAARLDPIEALRYE